MQVPRYTQLANSNEQVAGKWYFYCSLKKQNGKTGHEFYAVRVEAQCC